MRDQVLTAIMVFVISGTAWGQGANTDPGKTNGVQSRETMAKMHRQMAEVHTKVADCLASDRPISECQQQMATMCSAMHGMMGNTGMHGMTGSSGMQGMVGCPVMKGDQRTGTDNKQPKK